MFLIKDNKLGAIFWFIVYIASFFLKDNQSIISVSGMFALLCLYTFEGERKSKGEAAKGTASGIYIIVFVILELFFSYYIRIYQRDIFNFGSITIVGVTIINSFVIWFELVTVLVYYICFARKNIFSLIKRVVLFVLLILLPFIFENGISAAYVICIEKAAVNTMEYWNLCYRAFILAGFVEEIIYRGMLYDELKKHMKNCTAVILQAMIFTLVHAERVRLLFTDYSSEVLINLVVVFAMGIISALMRNKSDSIIPGIVMHGALNGGVYNFMMAVASSNF